MVENKKVETPKTGAASTRTPVDQPAETVKAPSVEEVKVGSATTSKSIENIDKHVETVAQSVDELNKALAKEAAAEPFKKPIVETVKPLTADERLSESVAATAKSVEEYNRSAKATLNTDSAPEITGKPKPEVSRVSPLTGELRSDPEDDSYVTPGKVLAPPAPKPGEPAPVVAEAPLVISPLTGEIKPADQVSYPTPAHARSHEIVSKAMDKHGKKFELEGSNLTKFGVPPGHQVSLLHANEHAWANDEAIKEDRAERAKMLAEAMLSSDGLRRTRRVQKNLR